MNRLDWLWPRLRLQGEAGGGQSGAATGPQFSPVFDPLSGYPPLSDETIPVSSLSDRQGSGGGVGRMIRGTETLRAWIADTGVLVVGAGLRMKQLSAVRGHAMLCPRRWNRLVVAGGVSCVGGTAGSTIRGSRSDDGCVESAWVGRSISGRLQQASCREDCTERVRRLSGRGAESPDLVALCPVGGWLVQVVVVRSAAMEVSGEPVHLVTLVAKDGALDEQLDARILLPSDLLKSMLPEDRE